MDREVRYGPTRFDVDHAPPNLGIEFPGGRIAARDARIVDQNIDCAERREGRLGRCLNGVFLSDIHGAGNCPTEFFEPAFGVLEARGVAIPQRNRSSGTQHLLCNGITDAAARAGDDRHAALEIESIQIYSSFTERGIEPQLPAADGDDGARIPSTFTAQMIRRRCTTRNDDGGEAMQFLVDVARGSPHDPRVTPTSGLAPVRPRRPAVTTPSASTDEGVVVASGCRGRSALPPGGSGCLIPCDHRPWS